MSEVMDFMFMFVWIGRSRIGVYETSVVYSTSESVCIIVEHCGGFCGIWCGWYWNWCGAELVLCLWCS